MYVIGIYVTFSYDFYQSMKIVVKVKVVVKMSSHEREEGWGGEFPFIM